MDVTSRDFNQDDMNDDDEWQMNFRGHIPGGVSEKALAEPNKEVQRG